METRTAVSTREEIFRDARREIEHLRTRLFNERTYGAASRRDEWGFEPIRMRPLLASDVTATLHRVAALRALAIAADPAPRGPDIAWYVSIRRGVENGFLYGPLATQGEALKALPYVRMVADDVAHGQAAFASFGTVTFTGPNPPEGRLNAAVADRRLRDAQALLPKKPVARRGSRALVAA